MYPDYITNGQGWCTQMLPHLGTRLTLFSNPNSFACCFDLLETYTMNLQAILTVLQYIPKIPQAILRIPQSIPTRNVPRWLGTGAGVTWLSPHVNVQYFCKDTVPNMWQMCGSVH